MGYIHLNPLRSGLVDTIEHLATYPWSGHAALMGKTSHPWQETVSILAHFAKSPAKAQRAYEVFVATGVHEGRREDLTGGGLLRSTSSLKSAKRDREAWAYDERILGSSAFVHEIKREFEQERTEMKPAPGSVTRLVSRVATKLRLSVREVTGGSKRAQIVEARAIISYVAVRSYGAPLAEVARTLHVSKQSILRGVDKGEGLLRERKWTLQDFSEVTE